MAKTKTFDEDVEGKGGLSSSPSGGGGGFVDKTKRFFNPITLSFVGTVTAFVLVTLTTFSTPFGRSFYFLHSSQANGVKFGVWGWCLDEYDVCLEPMQLGYTWDPEVSIPITKALVFFPTTMIVLVLALISFMPVFYARDARTDRVLRSFTWTAFGSSALGFAFAMGIFGTAKARFEKWGWETTFGPLLWMSLVATLILLAVSISSHLFFPPPPVRRRRTTGISTKTSLATMRDMLKRCSRALDSSDEQKPTTTTTIATVSPPLPTAPKAAYRKKHSRKASDVEALISESEKGDRNLKNSNESPRSAVQQSPPAPAPPSKGSDSRGKPKAHPHHSHSHHRRQHSKSRMLGNDGGVEMKRTVQTEVAMPLVADRALSASASPTETTGTGAVLPASSGGGATSQRVRVVVDDRDRPSERTRRRESTSRTRRSDSERRSSRSRGPSHTERRPSESREGRE